MTRLRRTHRAGRRLADRISRDGEASRGLPQRTGGKPCITGYGFCTRSEAFPRADSPRRGEESSSSDQSWRIAAMEEQDRIEKKPPRESKSLDRRATRRHRGPKNIEVKIGRTSLRAIPSYQGPSTVGVWKGNADRAFDFRGRRMELWPRKGTKRNRCLGR